MHNIFIDFINTSLSLFFVILAGMILRLMLLKDDSFWQNMNGVNFYLLVPALVFLTLIQTDLRTVWSMKIVFAIGLALCFIIAVLWLYAYLFVPQGTSTESYTSIFQTSLSWNGTMALAVGSLAFHSQETSRDYTFSLTGSLISTGSFDSSLSVALGMAILVPLGNGVNAAVVSRLLGKQLSLWSVVRNPTVFSSIAGVIFSLSGMKTYNFVASGFEIIGNAAVASALLVLGASLRLSGFTNKQAIALSCLCKLFLMPALTLTMGHVLGINSTLLHYLVIAVAAPSAAYYVTSSSLQSKGDIPLYASCCSVQTLVALLTLPLWAMFVFEACP